MNKKGCIHLQKAHNDSKCLFYMHNNSVFMWRINVFKLEEIPIEN